MWRSVVRASLGASAKRVGRRGFVSGARLPNALASLAAALNQRIEPNALAEALKKQVQAKINTRAAEAEEAPKPTDDNPFTAGPPGVRSGAAASVPSAEEWPSASAATAMPSSTPSSYDRDRAIASLSERATFVVRLERAFYELPASERNAPSLLALLNQCGFHQRVVDTYEQRLTDEEANDPSVIEQCWAAQRKLRDAREANQSLEDFPQPAPLPASNHHAPATSFSPPQPAPSAGPSAAYHPSASVASPSPSGVLYISRYGNDPSRLKEYTYSEARDATRRLDIRSRWIAFLVLVVGACGFSLIAKHNMTDEQREKLQDQTANIEEQIRAFIKGGGGLVSPVSKVPVERPKTRMADVHGCDEAKAEVLEVIEYLKDPSRFNRLGGKMPKGVLLLGPPGTGKTLLARAIAGEAGVPFFSATGADFEEMYQGVGSKRIRELFAEAKKMKPSIVFIDEIDSVGGKRDEFDPTMTRTSLNQLLTELDGFQTTSGVIVVAATNFADKIDPALLRPGRFDRHVTVGVPDIKGRQALLDAYAKKLKLDASVDLNLLARATAGMTGADLSHLVNTAALHAAATDQPIVRHADFEYARDHILMGAARTTAVNSPELKRQISVYESGKTLVALHTPHARPLHKVTIMQRGSQLGRTTQTQAGDNDVTQQSYEEMLAALDCRMGGRVAEELMYGPDAVSSNGARDLAAANQLARAMVMQFGFGVKHGVVADADVARFGTSASPEAKQSVDDEVRLLLSASYHRAKRLLQVHNVELRRLSEALQQHETLDTKQIERATRGRPID